MLDAKACDRLHTLLLHFIASDGRSAVSNRDTSSRSPSPAMGPLVMHEVRFFFECVLFNFVRRYGRWPNFGRKTVPQSYNPAMCTHISTYNVAIIAL